MNLRCVLPLAILTSVLHAEVAEFVIEAGQPQTVSLPSVLDDSNYMEPVGYEGHGGQTHWFVRAIEISNTGKKPLIGHLLAVENRDWMSMDGLRRSLGLTSEEEKRALTIERLFTFWRDHHSHGGTGSSLANEPFATLNFWGYTLCGEDTQSFAKLANGCGIPARYVQLNGHIAGEYSYDGAWHMVDGDQDAIYLKLDNQTLASADDLRADPFLALRSRVFGRHSPWDLSVSAFNMALVEHVSLETPKPIRFKTAAAPLSDFILPAGETLVWHCDTPPETVVGKLLTDDPEELRVAALASIEHRAVAGNWQPKDGAVKISSPFPIWKAVNETTGKSVAIPAGEPVFHVTVPVKSADDKITIFSQCSRLVAPQFCRGENVAQLNSKDGVATVRINYEPVKDTKVPSVKVAAREPVFSGPPVFTITAEPRPETMWWQVSAQRDFAFVVPSLEGVTPAANDLRFDALTDTFLSPGKSYFIRVKTRANGVWSAWSESVEFRVSKPAAPSDATFEASGGKHVILSWKLQPGTARPESIQITPGQTGVAQPAPETKHVEYLIFGSNRRDFIPEVFASNEITEMNHFTVIKQRENHNQVGISKANDLDFVPQYRFYRIIARRGKVLSVPSALFELPDELAKDLPPATILQVRVENQKGKEIYHATEMPLPKLETPAAKTEETPKSDQVTAKAETPKPEATASKEQPPTKADDKPRKSKAK